MHAKNVTALDWDQVRVFLAVMRAGQLAAAAHRLTMDVSTVSRRIDRLEEDIGLHLFDRTKEGTLPTAAAEAMLAAAEEMEAALAKLATATDAVEKTAEGVVRLTCPPGVADAFVAPLLLRFHAKYPRVMVELDASIGYADLTRREADIALRAMRPRSGDLVSVRVVATPTIPMTSSKYARELGRLERWDDARWVAWGNDLSHLPDARWMQKHVSVVPVFRSSHFASLLAAAETGLGVVLASEPFAEVRRLVPLTLTRTLSANLEELPLGELWLVGHRALRAVPRIAALWDFIAVQLSDASRAKEMRAL